MRRFRLIAPAAVVSMAMLFAGCAASPDSTPTPSSTDATATAAPHRDAAAICAEAGGEAQERQPTFGTNNDESTWVALGEPVELCRFETGSGDTSTRIYVDPVTLSSSSPTLAALAYLAKVPMHADPALGNPATQYCADLGGASTYGPGPAGGGLVAKDDPIDVVIAPCVFADGSFIEEWGIAYHSDGTIRGADLEPLFRFDTSSLPPVFPANR